MSDSPNPAISPCADHPHAAVIGGQCGACTITTTDTDTATLYEAQQEAALRLAEERDGAYRERAHLVAWIAALHPAVIAPAPDVDEDGWQIVYITVGDWQMSWHISPRDAALFKDIEHVRADDPRALWDGHTTEAKYVRIRQHTRVVHINRRLQSRRNKHAETGFARGFRLHHHGAALDGAVFPSGRAVLLDLEDAGFATSAPTLDALLLHYPHANIEWADQSGTAPAPVVHSGDEQQAIAAPQVDDSAPHDGYVVHDLVRQYSGSAE
ncbi:hypothetical protein ACIOHE_15800 [Streptomyces sp. NPDC087851]|uniref:hypothetical protein n=1 Tax=Streptomyces sp. NPDC087851 TaxID=3365810 RepID=UPI003830E794